MDFDTLYRSHYARVLGLCMRLLRRATQAEDAAQEVFVRAYRTLERYDDSQPFAAWVLGIASNHCIDLLRRRTREAKLFDEEAIEAEATGTPAPDALIDAERDAQVRAAIAALPDNYRLPIVLAYYNESSYDEIAEVLGITRNHVGVLLLRAKHALRRALAGQEDS
ncbi:MAG: sigma-70 family RNA polymerase sigma factor [Gammaproteobacteria bacterium]|nr:sigma-70 family RNA polymerase sigma factor [Gammaproteobacteria bacterium]